MLQIYDLLMLHVGGDRDEFDGRYSLKCSLFLFPFLSLRHMVVSFESVDEILKCEHSNESFLAIRSCGASYFAVQGGSNF